MSAPKGFQEFGGDLYHEGAPIGAKPVREGWAGHRTVIRNTADLRACLRAGEFAWPGCYRLYFLTKAGEVLSFAAVRKEYRQVSWAIRCRVNTGRWVDQLCSSEMDEVEIKCDHTGEIISPAKEEVVVALRALLAKQEPFNDEPDLEYLRRWGGDQ